MSASGIARSTKRSELPPMNTNSRPPSERMSGVTYGRPGCATMSGSVTSGVGEGSTVGDGRGVATATGDALAGGCEGAGDVCTGAAHADRTAAARRIATFISRPTLAPDRSCEGSAAGRLWGGGGAFHAVTFLPSRPHRQGADAQSLEEGRLIERRAARRAGDLRAPRRARDDGGSRNRRVVHEPPRLPVAGGARDRRAAHGLRARRRWTDRWSSRRAIDERTRLRVSERAIERPGAFAGITREQSSSFRPGGPPASAAHGRAAEHADAADHPADAAADHRPARARGADPCSRAAPDTRAADPRSAHSVAGAADLHRA